MSAAVGNYVVIRLFWGWIGALTALFIGTAIVLVLAASWVTIQLAPAMNGQTNFIHAVKMGYPTFWINVGMAGAVALGLRGGRSHARMI